MKKVLAFAASTSSTSINQALVTWAASRLKETEATVIRLRDFPMPLFSVDVEREEGHPENAFLLHKLIRENDGIMLSMAEHNGAYTAAFKSAFDWLSRLEGKVWENKPLLLLSTSKGGRGALSVLQLAANRFPYDGGEVIATFSLPRFSTNFIPGEGITDPALRKEFHSALSVFEAHLAGKSLE